MNQIGKTKRNDRTIQFIKLSNFSFLIFKRMKNTIKNQNIAHIREKLQSFIIKNSIGFSICFKSFHLEITQNNLEKKNTDKKYHKIFFLKIKKSKLNLIDNFFNIQTNKKKQIVIVNQKVYINIQLKVSINGYTFIQFIYKI